MRAAPQGLLLEREAEIEILEGLLAEAAGGRGAAVLVEGAAGIGKTELLARVRRAAAGSGLRVLSATGGELERDFAYGIVRQLLERLVAHATGDERAALLHGAAALAAPLIGVGAVEPARRDAPAMGGDPAAVALHGLYWLTANLSAESPLLVIVDDAHWADAASLRFLTYLARRVDELPVLLVLATRPAARDAIVDELRALERAGARVVGLEPLSAEASADFVRSAFGAGASDPFCRACHAVTAGNPFLLGEVVAALREDGVAPDEREVARVERLVPAAVSRAIVVRLGRLAPPSEALARAVAVLGVDVELRHAAALACLAEAAAAAAADALTAAEILAAGRPLEFVHPIVRAAIHETIPAAERALLHRRAARLLDDEAVDAERIAPHLLAAEPGDDPWAVALLRRAAARSMGRGAPDAAVRYLRRALAEPPAANGRPSVLAELGNAELRAARPDDAIEHLREALAATDDPRTRAQMAQDLALGLVAPGHYLQAVEMLDQAVEAAKQSDPELALRLEAELLCAARLVPQTLPILHARLAQIDRDVPGRTPGERMLLATLAHQGLHDGRAAAEVRDQARRALDGGLIDEQGGDSGLVLDAVFAASVANDWPTADRAYEAALADARARGSVIGFARISTMRSIFNLRRGAVGEAESDARAAIDAATQPGYRIAGMAHGPLVDALIERGALQDAGASLRAAGLDGELADTMMINFVLHSRGWLRLAEGRAADAAGDLAELGRREEKWWGRNPGVFPWRSGLALACHRLADVERARELAAEELDLARAWGTASAIGAALRTAGLVRGGDDGIELLRASVEALAASGARLELSRSLVELGAALRRTGRRAAAREPLHEGMELAHVCAASALAARARQELVATGARPRRIMRSGVDALTPSERRVAAMAAKGLTNREIAQALFVTVRTVQVHLTHTYEKLDISSREELPDALAR